MAATTKSLWKQYLHILDFERSFLDPELVGEPHYENVLRNHREAKNWLRIELKKRAAKRGHRLVFIDSQTPASSPESFTEERPR